MFFLKDDQQKDRRKALRQNKERFQEVLTLLELNNNEEEIETVLNDRNRADDFLDFLLVAEEAIPIIKGTISYLLIQNLFEEQDAKEIAKFLFADPQQESDPVDKDSGTFRVLGQMALESPKMEKVMLQALQRAVSNLSIK